MSQEEKTPPLFVVVASAVIVILVVAVSLLTSGQYEVDAQIAELTLECEQLRATTTKLQDMIKGFEDEREKLHHLLQELEAELAALTTEVLQPVSPKVVYLTFDDGPSHITHEILDILNKYAAKATFFVNGNNTAFGHSTYQRIVAEGHALGNHTYSHNYSRIYASIEAYWEDHMRLEDLLWETVGVRPTIIRFPGGSNNTVSYNYGGEHFMDQLVSVMSQAGYEYFDWSVTSLDASALAQDSEAILDAVVKGVRAVSNPIVLFHDSYTKSATVEALPVIIESLQELGCVFRILSAESPVVKFK